MQENESFDFLGATDADFLMFAMEEDDLREQDRMITYSSSTFKTYVEDRSELASLYPDMRFSTEELFGYDLYCIVDGMYMNIETFDSNSEAKKAEVSFRLRLERKLKEHVKSAFNDIF